MKRIITFTVLLALSFNGFAQKLDYDRDSKWFFGFNVGGTWNTTDVKNKTNLGWGLTLGRAFNYNYGKKFSFDLRLRYLGGNWYGQDYDTTNVLGNAFYPSESPVIGAYDSLGYTINNFTTEAHELGLEMVLHANSLRERTGWDPYIFGGVGIVWSTTMGDIYRRDVDSLGTSTVDIYDYSVGGMTKTEWNQMSDDIYDEALVGKRVSIVPNLGIGLAYQVGPKFSIGLEHRTMFYLQNDFDGYLGNSSKWGMKNDLYHYSGLVMKFHLGRKSTNTDINTNTNTNTNNLTGNGGCEEPTVTFKNPRTGNSTVSNRNFNFEAIVTNVSSKENIQFYVNGNQITTYSYNAASGKFTSSIALNEGINAIRLRAANGCGDDEEQVTIQYINCVAPIIRMLNPTSTVVNTEQSSFSISAQILNAGTINLYVNEIMSNSYSFNGSTFSANVDLKRGENRIKITANNECGIVEQILTVNYGECTSPLVKILSGSGTINVSEPTFSLKSQVQHVTGKPEVKLSLNGNSTGFSWTNSASQLSATLNLVAGQNTVVVTGTNTCGANSSTLIINYSPCESPVITMLNPASGNITVNANTFDLKANVLGVASANEIRVTVNGLERMGGNYNNRTQIFSQTISLRDGENTIVLKAKNECGEVTKSITIVRKPCVGPQISMSSPANQNLIVETALLNFSATVLNVSSSSQINLQVNGVTIARKNYNSATGLLTSNLSLNSGMNTIVLTATNDCAVEELTYSVTYNNCQVPKIEILEPNNGTTVTVNSLDLKVKATNIVAANQIVVKMNGSTITGGSFNASTGIFSVSLTLQEGNNTIDVIGTNECGTDSKRTSVILKGCEKPKIDLIQPSTSSVSTENGSVLVKATFTNISNIGQIKVKMAGVLQNGGTFNAANGAFEITLAAPQGASNVILSGTNECGTASKSFSIRHTPCAAPTLTVLSPNANTTTNSTVLVQASITNASDISQITLKVNGNVISGGSFNSTTGLYERLIDLGVGQNNINITVVNECGRDSKTTNVRRDEEQKITICHYPPGNTENPQQIEIPLSAWPAHQAHGDVLGPCPLEEEEPEPCGPRFNPGNSVWQFCLITPSGTFNRDNLASNPSFNYSGPASSLFFKPIAGGGQAYVNGQGVNVQPGQYYLFEGNLTVNVSSQHPGSMGHWVVCIESDNQPTFGNGNSRPTSPCEPIGNGNGNSGGNNGGGNNGGGNDDGGTGNKEEGGGVKPIDKKPEEVKPKTGDKKPGRD